MQQDSKVVTHLLGEEPMFGPLGLRPFYPPFSPCFPPFPGPAPCRCASGGVGYSVRLCKDAYRKFSVPPLSLCLCFVDGWRGLVKVGEEVAFIGLGRGWSFKIHMGLCYGIWIFMGGPDSGVARLIM